jgi:hypothetical protein
MMATKSPESTVGMREWGSPHMIVCGTFSCGKCGGDGVDESR